MSKPGFAQSTLDATKWLIAYHPERLEAWLARHERGLEIASREQIAARAHGQHSGEERS